MVPVDSIGKAMEIIRRRMAENRDLLDRPAASTAAETRPPAGTAVRQRSLRETAERRIRALDPADANFRRKAARAIVEGALLAEFGEPLAGDPDFRELMMDVADALLDDESLRTDLDALVHELRSG